MLIMFARSQQEVYDFFSATLIQTSEEVIK